MRKKTAAPKPVKPKTPLHPDSGALLFGKQMISIRLDMQVLDYFRKTGKGWQSRVNQALIDFMEKNR